MVIKWSAFSPSTPTIRVRIALKSTIVLEKNEIKQKEAGIGILKTVYFNVGNILSLQSAAGIL